MSRRSIRAKLVQIDDAERLIGPSLRELAAAPQVLCRHFQDGEHIAGEAVPEPHGGGAPEP
jgi:hypothetical protein